MEMRRADGNEMQIWNGWVETGNDWNENMEREQIACSDYERGNWKFRLQNII